MTVFPVTALLFCSLLPWVNFSVLNLVQVEESLEVLLVPGLRTGDADEVGALPGAVGYPLGVGEVKDVQVTLESETLLSLGSPDSARQRFLICHKKKLLFSIYQKNLFL